MFLVRWSRRPDLNRQPTVYKTVALPIELRRRVTPVGVPAAVQSIRCVSPNGQADRNTCRAYSLSSHEADRSERQCRLGGVAATGGGDIRRTGEPQQPNRKIAQGHQHLWSHACTNG